MKKKMKNKHDRIPCIYAVKDEKLTYVALTKVRVFFDNVEICFHRRFRGTISIYLHLTLTNEKCTILNDCLSALEKETFDISSWENAFKLV